MTICHPIHHLPFSSFFLMSLYTYTHPVLILLLPYVAGFVFLLQFRDGKGDCFTIYVCVCVCVFAWGKRERRVLGIERLLSVVTCIGFLNACTQQTHNPSPNPTTREPCVYCLVCLSYLMHKSSGELLSRSSCRSQVSVPLISRPVPHYHWGGTTPM